MNTQNIASKLRLITLSLITISCLGTSCTSLQQTTVAATDDLYYTPNNKAIANEATAANQNQDPNQINNTDQSEYQDYQSYPDDRYLRLKVANRNRWDAIDDYGYWNDPRYNYAYYPSYGGWNSWYSGFYGSSWYNPFGMSMGFGWGGYTPYMNSYYTIGWGFNDFGYGGWNPYYASYWNPYAGYYNYYGGYAGGVPARRMHYQDPRATHTSAPGLAAYRNPSSSRSLNNYTNVVNGNTRYTGNANLNNNFGSLLKRVVTTNTNTNNANSWDRPARSFNSNNNSNQVKPYSSNNSSTTTPANNSSNSSGKSGGYNSSGSSSSSGRAPRSH